MGGSSFDPNVVFQALGVTVDMTSRTMGVRTRRFAMYVDDGEVQFSCFLVVLKNLMITQRTSTAVLLGKSVMVGMVAIPSMGFGFPSHQSHLHLHRSHHGLHDCLHAVQVG